MRSGYVDLCIFLAIVLLFVAGVSHGVTPSDLITFRPAPIEKLCLQDVDPSSARAIAATNEPLVRFKPWELPNLGHYASWKAELSQDEPAGIPKNLMNFSNTTPEIPASVGNATENITMINDTLVFW
jgi:hypothetical protein